MLLSLQQYPQHYSILESQRHIWTGYPGKTQIKQTTKRNMSNQELEYGFVTKPVTHKSFQSPTLRAVQSKIDSLDHRLDILAAKLVALQSRQQIQP